MVDGRHVLGGTASTRTLVEDSNTVRALSAGNEKGPGSGPFFCAALRTGAYAFKLLRCLVIGGK